MKKTISTILTLAALAAPLSGSICFANDPKTTTASSQYISNQSRKKEFQFGKLLNKNKWGKIALGATAGITALAGATIAGLEVLRAKSYSTSNDTCKFSIDGIAQELKHGTCDNMFKYAVSHLKSFNNVAKSCSVNVNGTSKLPEDNDINNLINFANHYHLNLDEVVGVYNSTSEYRHNYHIDNFLSDLESYSKDAKKYNSTLKDILNMLKTKDEKGNNLFLDLEDLNKILSKADTYKLSFNSLKDYAKALTKVYASTYKDHNITRASIMGFDEYMAFAIKNNVPPNKLKMISSACSFKQFDQTLSLAKQYNFDLFKILESLSKFSQENYEDAVALIDPNFRYAKYLLEYVTKHKVKLHDIINCCADKAKGNNALEKDFISDLGKIADHLNDYPEDGRDICKIYKKYANRSKKCANLEVCLYDILNPAAAEAERSYGIKW